MSNDRVQSYANAFYEAAFERWLGSLESATSAIAGNSTLLDNLQAADADFGQRQTALQAILPPDADPLVRNLLYTLMQRGDLSLVGEVTEVLRTRMRSAERGPIPVEVTTAVALDAGQRQELEAKLEKQYGNALMYEYHVDRAILGGMIVRVGDKLIDGSVASRLAAMKQQLGVAVAE
jgi:F-type H+-transporting ATPase subunit delta